MSERSTGKDSAIMVAREQIAQAIEAQIAPGGKWWDALPDELRGVVGAWVASSARIARQCPISPEGGDR